MQNARGTLVMTTTTTTVMSQKLTILYFQAKIKTTYLEKLIIGQCYIKSEWQQVLTLVRKRPIVKNCSYFVPYES